MILKGFLKKELIQSLRNTVLVFALLFMPLVQVILISYTISNEAKNLKIAMIADPSDYLMQRLYNKAVASRFFIPVTISKDQDPVAFIEDGRADAVIVAPPGGLSRNVYRQVDQRVQLLMDASNVLIGQSLSGYVKGIMQGVLAEEFSGKLSKKGMHAIDFDSRILFNPEMNTRFYIVPGIMSMVVAMTIISIVCTSFAREKECGTLETLISAPIGKKHIIIGKITPAIIIAFLNFFSIWILGNLLFNLPFRGAVWMLISVFLVFSVSISMFALYLSTFCRDQQQAMLALMLSLFILMMLSGVMFPIENMPFLLKGMAYVNPLSHYVYLSRNIILKGCSVYYLFKHLVPLVLFGVFTGYLGVRRFKQTL